MKKITFLAILIAALTTATAQVSFSVPIGFSSNKVPTIGTNLQWNIGHFIIAGGVDAQMSRKVMNGNLYWSRVGTSLNLREANTLEITTGVGAYQRSSDHKSLNEGVGLVSVYYIHPMDIRSDGALFAGITTTSKFSFFSGGLRFTFNKRDHYGCPATRMR